MVDFWDTGEDTTFDYDTERQKLIDNLDLLKSMSVEEATLYKKWQELNKDLSSTMARKSEISRNYDLLWIPTDIYNVEQTIAEIEQLDPVVELVESGGYDTTRWADIRRMIHTMEFVRNPGRNLPFFVKDRNTGKILGQMSIASDAAGLGVRDKYLGWTKDNRFVDKRINNVAMATTVVSVQPLGFNFLGGKLIAALTTSPVVRQAWKDVYNDTLISVTTTSLYGIHSQYNGIPHYKTVGESAGAMYIKPDDEFYFKFHDWLKEHHADWYLNTITKDRLKHGDGEKANGPATGVKQRILSKIFRELDIKAGDYVHGYKRGVYVAQMYDNGNEFLQAKIPESDLKMKQKFIEGDEYTVKWWKPKAIRRYRKMVETGRIKPNVLWYVDMIGMPWETAKKRYLQEVGR